MFQDIDRNDVETLEDLNREFFVFDIETSGLGANEEIISFCVRCEEGFIGWVNTNGEDADVNIEEWDLAQRDPNEHFVTGVVQSEKELLEKVKSLVYDMVDEEDVLVAYNGEVWGGGFDNSFIRTRCIKNDMDFVLRGCNYMDLFEMIGKHGRFNTEMVSVRGLLKSDMVNFAESIGIETEGLNKSPLRDKIESEGYDRDEFRE